MKTLLIAFAAVGVSATIASAQDYVVLDRTADTYDRVQIQPDGTLRVVDAISRETGVPAAVIEEQRTRYGLGYGGLLIANSIAAETGRPVDEIITVKRSGRGWGDIARQYNVNLGNVVSRAQRADVAFNGSTNTKRDAMKAAKFVNGHDARDGKLDGTGPGHARGHSKAVTVVNGNGHGNGKGNGKGKGKGHGKH